MSAIHLYSLAEGKTTQVTDGMSDAKYPVFDKDGKYLYFTASTDSGPSMEQDLHSFSRTVTRSIYLTVLAKDQPSPLAPESDEEKPAEQKAEEKKAEAKESGKEEAKAEAAGEGRRQDRLRQPGPAHPGATASAAPLHRAASGQGRPAVCSGGPRARAGNRIRNDGSPIRSQDTQVGRGHRRGAQLRDFAERREDALPAGRPLGDRRAETHGRGAGRRASSAGSSVRRTGRGHAQDRGH